MRRTRLSQSLPALLAAALLPACASAAQPAAARPTAAPCGVEDGRVGAAEGVPGLHVHPDGVRVRGEAWEPFGLPRPLPVEQALRLEPAGRTEAGVPLFREPGGEPDQAWLPVASGCVFQLLRGPERAWEMQAVPADRASLDSVALETGSCPGCEDWRAVVRADGTLRWEGIAHVRPMGGVVRPAPPSLWREVAAAARALPDSLDRRYGPLRLHGGHDLTLFFADGTVLRTRGEPLPEAAAAIRDAALAAAHRAVAWEFVEPGPDARE